MRSLAPTLFLLLGVPALAQDDSAHKKRTALPADDSIWHYEGIGEPFPTGGSRPAPPAILPEDWLVLSATAGDVRGELMIRAANPASRAPGVGDDLGRPHRAKWESRRGQPVSDAACAFTHITCEKDQVRMARLSGAGLLIVNGEGFLGDSERRGDRGVPIALHAGSNDVYVSDIRGPFDLELWGSGTRTILGSWDAVWPAAEDTWGDLCFPVFNVSVQPIELLHVHYGHARALDDARGPSLSDWRDGGRVLPLGLRIGATYLFDMFEESLHSLDVPSITPVSVWACDDDDADRELLRWPGKSGFAPVAARNQGRGQDRLLATPLARIGLHVLFVYESQSSLARARFDQESIWYRAGYVPEAIRGSELLQLPRETQPDTVDWHIRNADNDSRYVLYGNADAGGAWKHFVPDSFAIQVFAGRVAIDGKSFEGDDICGWFKFKTAAYEDVLVIADTGSRGAFLGYLLQPLLSNAAELDYCFWDSRGEGGAPRVIASGRFAEQKRDASGR